MLRYFALKTPLKNAACNRKQEEYLYFPVFPTLRVLDRAVFPGKYRPGIPREIPPRYFPDNPGLVVGWGIALHYVHFYLFVLKPAVMILVPLASHPISAFCASFLNKRPTPSECGASSSSCPEYNINYPVVNRSCPDWVHRVSQSPSTARLNIRISAVTWAVSPASYIVCTFQVPMWEQMGSNWSSVYRSASRGKLL